MFFSKITVWITLQLSTCHKHFRMEMKNVFILQSEPLQIIYRFTEIRITLVSWLLTVFVLKMCRLPLFSAFKRATCWWRVLWRDPQIDFETNIIKNDSAKFSRICSTTLVTAAACMEETYQSLNRRRQNCAARVAQLYLMDQLKIIDFSPPNRHFLTRLSPLFRRRSVKIHKFPRNLYFVTIKFLKGTALLPRLS